MRVWPARLPSMVKMESELYACTQHVSTFHTHTLVWVGWIREAFEVPTLGSWVTHPLSVLPSVPLSHPWNKTPNTMQTMHQARHVHETKRDTMYLHLSATLFHNNTIEQHGVCLHWRLLVLYLYLNCVTEHCANSVVKKCCCHQKCCGGTGCAVV